MERDSLTLIEGHMVHGKMLKKCVGPLWLSNTKLIWRILFNENIAHKTSNKQNL